jgi:alcohol dehydrogenase class IV
VLVLTDAGVLRAGVAGPLIEAVQKTGRETHVFSDIPGNPNVPDVERAHGAVRSEKPTAIVALGGGSVIDTAKACGILLNQPGADWEALQWGKAKVTNRSLPVIAVPTTAGTGSEVSHVAVIGDRRGFKKGLVHREIFPYAAIVDGALMRSLPASITAATGVDALAHALEAFLGKRANAITDALALGAMRELVQHLPETTRNGTNLKARRAVALAATMAGAAMDQSGLGLVHALCGPLAAHYKLHHGLGITLLLAPSLDFDAEAIEPERWRVLRDALALPTASAPSALGDWARQFIRGLGLPAGLREAGLNPDNLDVMAHEAMQMAMIGNNVRSAGVEACKAVLEAALS